MFLLVHDYDFGERVKLRHDTSEDCQIWMVVAIQTSLEGHQKYTIAAGNLEYIADNDELAPISSSHTAPYSTLVESIYDVGASVYVIHDTEQRLCTIMSIMAYWDSSVLYQVLCGADFAYWAVAQELSTEMPSDLSSFDDSSLDDSQITSE